MIQQVLGTEKPGNVMIAPFCMCDPYLINAGDTCFSVSLEISDLSNVYTKLWQFDQETLFIRKGWMGVRVNWCCPSSC